MDGDDPRIDPAMRTTAGGVLAIVATTALAVGSVALGYVVVMLTAAAALLADGRRGRTAGVSRPTG